MGQTKLILIRHGRTDWNAEERFQGSIDRPLDAIGIRQANELGMKLASYPISAVYTSPLIRAYKTAEILAQFCQCCVEIKNDLRERHFGSIEGLTKDEFHRQFKMQIEVSNQMTIKERLHFKYCERAESYFETAERGVPCLMQICKQHPEGTVAVVTHGSFIRALFMFLFDQNENEITLANTEYICLLKEENGFRLFNESDQHVDKKNNQERRLCNL
jgi:broad specificity phosphatase PhoE